MDEIIFPKIAQDFGQDKVGTIRLPELVDEGMWCSSFMVGDVVGLCWIALTDSGLPTKETLVPDHNECLFPLIASAPP
jgi:hypothetical protein